MSTEASNGAVPHKLSKELIEQELVEFLEPMTNSIIGLFDGKSALLTRNVLAGVVGNILAEIAINLGKQEVSVWYSQLNVAAMEVFNQCLIDHQNKPLN